jgi:DNA-binding NtrC family response regulator
MPGLSGVDLAIATKEEDAACQILLFSAQAYTEDLMKTARDRGYSFRLLAKPIDPPRLLREIVAITEPTQSSL